MRKLIIFDLDGTLAHTAPDLLATLNRVTGAHSIKPMRISDIGQIVGHGAKAMIARAFEINETQLSDELHEKLFEAFLEDYSQNLTTQTRLFEGVEASIDELIGQGFNLAVCTNKKHAMAVPLLEQLGVLHHFSAVTGGDSFEFRKPDPKHLEETAKLAGNALRDAIMVGDSETDINAAIHARIPSVAVTFGYSGKPVEELGANAIISHYSELIDAIDRLASM